MSDAEIIPISSASRPSSTKGMPRPEPKVRCRATTSSGRPCRNYAVTATGYCRTHAGEERKSSSRPAPTKRQPHNSIDTSDEPLGLEGFFRHRLAGDYDIDDFGYDRELSREILLPLAGLLYHRYFRVRLLGVDRVPDVGSALIVANHSGSVPLDAVMMQYGLATEHPNKRIVRCVAANLAFRTPFIGPLARKSGNAVATEEDTFELLNRGELVGVFPEGYKGVGKGWRERYRLQRFGRGGFMQTALRARVPIIPVAIVGAEEAYPMIANAKWLARALGYPYFPITPTFPLFGPLGALPLPSKWIIEFGEPIDLSSYPDDAADDAMLVFDLADRVRDRIQQMLFENLNKRGSAFF
ncbi:MAG: lysophospholipid acyltransferase family protein [Actinomycetota bacterium]